MVEASIRRHSNSMVTHNLAVGILGCGGIERTGEPDAATGESGLRKLVWRTDLITTRPTLTHKFAQPGSYSVGVRVVDSGSYTSPWVDSVQVEVVGTTTPFELTGNLHKQGQRYRVDLRWSGASSEKVDVFRNGSLIATVSTASHSEFVAKGSGPLTYKVCEAGSNRCSNEWTTVV
jgi:hypothetical protein